MIDPKRLHSKEPRGSLNAEEMDSYGVGESSSGGIGSYRQGPHKQVMRQHGSVDEMASKSPFQAWEKIVLHYCDPCARRPSTDEHSDLHLYQSYSLDRTT